MMTNRTILCMLIVIIISGVEVSDLYSGTLSSETLERNEKFIIAPTAKGWNLMLSDNSDSDSSTVLVNPDGKKFDIGKTLFLRCPKTILWVVRVLKLNENFLMIYFHPSASGAVPAYFFHLDKNNIPTLSAKILNHYELDVQDRNGVARCGIADGGIYGKEVAQVFFADSDQDGIPELKDNDVWKWGGKVTYYRWVKNEKVFKPLWIEMYADYLKMVSREKVYHSKTRDEQLREWSER